VEADARVIDPPESRASVFYPVSCLTPVTCMAAGSSDAKHTGVISLIAEQES
jgi:hypothetical protein